MPRAYSSPLTEIRRLNTLLIAQNNVLPFGLRVVDGRCVFHLQHVDGIYFEVNNGGPGAHLVRFNYLWPFTASRVWNGFCDTWLRNGRKPTNPIQKEEPSEPVVRLEGRGEYGL